MKQGIDIVSLAEEIKRREEAKKDLVADSNQIKMDNESTNIVLAGSDESFVLTDLAHKQIADYTKIPHGYYNRVKTDSPDLLAENVNHWLHHENKNGRRMIRTLDGKARAFLSDRYRRLDNHLIAEASLPTLLESPDIQIVSTDITDTRLYLKALFPRIEGDVKAGDIVQAGVVISNSEVGLGTLTVSPMLFRLICKNGMIADVAGQYGLKKYHLGRKVASLEESYEIFSDETLKADDKALMLKIQDSIRAAANKDVFNVILEQMREATTGQKIERPVKAVEVLARSFTLSSDEKDSVLENLIRNADYSRFGALNAITEVANEHGSYDRATELEAAGGQVLNLNPNQWKVIAEAA